MDEDLNLKARKHLFKKLMEREFRAEEYYNSDADAEVKEAYIPEYRKLIKEINRTIAELRALGVDFDEELNITEQKGSAK